MRLGRGNEMFPLADGQWNSTRTNQGLKFWVLKPLGFMQQQPWHSCEFIIIKQFQAEKLKHHGINTHAAS
jgi:hypothetical protein